MESLDQLIQKAEQKALRGRTGKAAQFEKERLVAPVAHPDEPELVSKALRIPTEQTTGRRGTRTALIEADERGRKFARALFFSGFNVAEAFKVSGYKYHPGKKNSGELRKQLDRPVVRDELERLCRVGRQVLEAEAFDITKGWLELASSNIMVFLEQGEDGTLQVRGNLAELPEEQQRQIKKIKVTRRVFTKGKDTEETTDTEIELWDKTKALDALSKIQGLYQDKMADAMKDFAGILAARLAQAEVRTGRVLTQEGTVEKP